MVSITLLVSAVLALATSQVNAIPQVIGTPDAVALFYSDCATSSQAGIPAQDQVLEPTDSTCYTFAFEGVDQAFTATGFHAVAWSGASCTGTATDIAQSPALNGCQNITGASYQVVAA
ncbi:hypothetical protein L207DRAFT_590459 [Hyaloscypha variabilis F]|uniref:Small secreted protein n=1 Tax=Hyaloscypha variabilis (strain UAMH 11265 / GT02V1 / F) TaxID=1149755 RepID=A0A2J6R2M9_HYAVF|nr:hypothetical protein L207DRAFT_590459 [Hyaloscypha variabilis F]